MIRIRKPHDKIIEEMMRKGSVEVPTGVGLYFSRLRQDLEDVAIIKPKAKDVFEIRRGLAAITRDSENHKYTNYRRTGKKWREII